MSKRLSSRWVRLNLASALTLAGGLSVPVIAQPPSAAVPPRPSPATPPAVPPSAPTPTPPLPATNSATIAKPPSKAEETRPAEQILGEALAHQIT